MPKKMHRALVKSARKRGMKPGSKKFNRYVFGTMAKRKRKR